MTANDYGVIDDCDVINSGMLDSFVIAPPRPVAFDLARWGTDPRPDLAGDSARWSALLTAAYLLDGDRPDGIFGVLHGLRTEGAGLAVANGRLRIEAGELGDAYPLLREVWLVPQCVALTALLADTERTV